jgi:hypothetical protein
MHGHSPATEQSASEPTSFGHSSIAIMTDPSRAERRYHRHDRSFER